MYSQRRGVASFEWNVLFTLIVIGIVGGLAVMRDAMVIECAETADAILHHNKSYYISPPLTADISFPTNDFEDGALAEAPGSTAGGSRYTQPAIPAGTSAVEVFEYENPKKTD